jgi:hypothetical protein
MPDLKLTKAQTLDEIHSLIRKAAVMKQPIVAVYESRERRLCPHILGLKEGRLRALCYQYGGGSSQGLQPHGSPENWRCICLEKLSEVRLLTERWHTGPSHSRRQTCVDEVEVDSEKPEPVESENASQRAPHLVRAASQAAGPTRSGDEGNDNSEE